MEMRRPIAALLCYLVSLVGQSAGATKLVPPFHLAYAGAGGDQSIDEGAPRSAQTAHRSENRLARGGPLHLYRSSAGKNKDETAQPAQRKKEVLGRARN